MFLIVILIMIGALVFMQQAVDHYPSQISYAVFAVAVSQIIFFAASAIPDRGGLLSQATGLIGYVSATIWFIRKDGKNVIPWTAPAAFLLLSVYHTMIFDGLSMAGSDFAPLFSAARWTTLGLGLISGMLAVVTRKNQ